MPDPLLYVTAQGIATVAAAVLVLAMGWLRKPISPLRCQAAAVVGIAGGLGAGYYVLRLHVAWPPLNGLDRFLTIVLPAALGIEFTAMFSRVPRSLAWLMRFTLAATMGRILLHDSVYVSGAEPQWSPMQATAVLLTCSALIAVVWGLLVWLSVRSPAGVSIALAAALTIQSTGISIMLAGYLQGGAAAFPLSAATVGTVASLCLLTSHQNVRAPIGICVVGLGSLLVIGRFFGGLSTEVALILMLAPLLCWGTELPQLRCRPDWVVGSLRLVLVAIPLAALLLQAKRKFDRDTAPLLIHRVVGQAARRLVAPGVVPGVRQAQHAEHGTQGEMRSGTINGPQQPCLSSAFRQPHSGQRKARDFEQQRNQSQQRDQAVQAPTEGEDLLLQVNSVMVGGWPRDDWRRQRREPATRCRSGYSAPDCRVDVLAVADHLSQAMIRPALGTGG